MSSRGRRWGRLRQQVLTEEPTCRECGETEDLEVDHIVPTSRGGGDERENLQTLCWQHNAEKGAMLPWEQEAWREGKRRDAEEARERHSAWLDGRQEREEADRAREAMFKRRDREYEGGLRLTPYRSDL